MKLSSYDIHALDEIINLIKRINVNIKPNMKLTKILKFKKLKILKEVHGTVAHQNQYSRACFERTFSTKI